MIAESTKEALRGKRVLITGGTTGIGRATALYLAGCGCRLLICGRDTDDLEAAVRAVLDEGGEISGVSVDLGTLAGIGRLFEEVDRLWGGLDIAVLNAGIGAKGPLVEMTHDECSGVLAVNLAANISCTLEVMKRLQRDNGGHIVLTGSLSAEVCEEGSAVYVAAKAGLRGFAASVRKEANPMGIRISLIEPGSTGSDMVDENPEEQERKIRGMKMIKAEDVARSIGFMICQPAWCDVIKLQIRPHLQLI